MVSYDTDEEQIEALKNWWNENGSQLMIGLIVVLAGTLGFQAWQTSVQEEGEAASALYEDMRVAITTATAENESTQVATARYLADTLAKEHASSVYAQFAALQMAKLALEQGDLDQAEKDMQWVVDQDDAATKALANLRLARIVFAKGESERALSLIEAADQGAYLSSYAELKGDIFTQTGKLADAREAYQTALNQMAEGESNPLLQMKLDDIVVTTGEPGIPLTAEEIAAQTDPSDQQDQPESAESQPEE